MKVRFKGAVDNFDVSVQDGRCQVFKICSGGMKAFAAVMKYGGESLGGPSSARKNFHKIDGPGKH